MLTVVKIVLLIIVGIAVVIGGIHFATSNPCDPDILVDGECVRLVDTGFGVKPITTIECPDGFIESTQIVTIINGEPIDIERPVCIDETDPSIIYHCGTNVGEFMEDYGFEIINITCITEFPSVIP